LGDSLDVQIDDDVLVNLQGFADIIDSVGGVRIDVPERVLLQTGNPTRKHDGPDAIGPGVIEMDSTPAIASARERRVGTAGEPSGYVSCSPADADAPLRGTARTIVHGSGRFVACTWNVESTKRSKPRADQWFT
jgi:hypothetical protein